jgi:hypothetical protein
MLILACAILLFLAFLVNRGADLGLSVLGYVLLAGVAFALHHVFPIPWRRP